MDIEAVQINTNRYAPEGSSAINLYSTGSASGLTLGQLVIAVCMRTATAYELQSVTKMNEMTKSAQVLEKATEWIERIVEGSASWTRAKAYLMNELGLTEAELPTDLKSFDNRMRAASSALTKVNAMMQTQQQDLIGLQSYVSRRDVAYSSSANIVKAFGRSTANLASKF